MKQSKHVYELVNPMIEGSFKNVYEANKPIAAAEDLWKNLSEHLISHVPKFIFTMRNTSSGSLHHFEVGENKVSSSYSIQELDLDIDKKQIDDFTKKVDSYEKVREKNNEKQQGGKRKRYEQDSSSSSSSSCDYYPTIRTTSPIAMFHYNTGFYYPNNNYNNSIVNPQMYQFTTPLFTPVFRPSLGTFIGLWP
jgi:hypothetical protein